MQIDSKPQPQPQSLRLAWRELIQTQAAVLLSQGRHSLEGIDLARWQTLKSRWRDYFLEPFDRLREFWGKPVHARILHETHYPGFRLQNIVLEALPGSLIADDALGWQVGLNLFLPPHEGAYTPVICPCGHGPKWQTDHQVPPQILARQGFAAALFDMPMFGEKSSHNDHFIQGSQMGMLGVWSNLFFLLDAIRTADYLQTRPDIDFSHGMGVTGVSGGGFTTLFMALVDDRTQAIAPVCSVAPLGGHIIEGLYTGCPENYLFGQASLGIDFDHLLCLASPLPCLVVGGTEDDLFRPEQVTQSFEQTRKIYRLEGAIPEERLDIYFENSPHRYTRSMAIRVAHWMRRWLLDDPNAIIVNTPEVDLEMIPPAGLDCGTASLTSGMLDFIKGETARLRCSRRWQATGANIQALLHLSYQPGNQSEPEHSTIEELPAVKWGYPGLRRFQLHRNGDLSIPLIEAHFPEASLGIVVCFGDLEKTRFLYQNGGLFGMSSQVFAADLRGFGELEPLPTDYDLYSWCGVDRALSDLVQLCGETVVGQQTSDALRVLKWIDSSRNQGTNQLIVYGRGEGALPALFASLLCPQVKQVVLDSFLCSFEALACAPAPLWQRYAYLPGILKHCDLPELIGRRSDKRFLLINPCDAMKQSLDLENALRLYGREHSHIRVRVDNRIVNAPGQRPGWDFGDPRGVSHLRLLIQDWLEVRD